jgi:hypothetical protein
MGHCSICSQIEFRFCSYLSPVASSFYLYFTMTTTYYPLRRDASYLVLQLSDLRVNERLDSITDTASLEAYMLLLANQVKQEGRDLGIDHLVIAGLGGCVAPALWPLGAQADAPGAVFAAVRVLKLLFDELRDQFQLEIFGVSGCVTGVGGELGIRDSNAMTYHDALVFQLLAYDYEDDSDVIFRAFEQDGLLLHAGESSFLWHYHYAQDGSRDLPIQRSLVLAEALLTA